MLRQTQNTCRIEGILSEIDINPTTFEKNGQRMEALSGKIIVKVVQKINGEEKELMIPIHMFSAKYTNKGTPNPAFDSISRVKNEYKSIAATGSEETADRVRITNAQIRMNEYYSADGRLISFPRVNTSFVNKITTGEFKPEATFLIEFAVGAADDEIGRDGEPTGRYKITALVPQYGGKVDIVPMYAESKSVIDAVSSYWNVGDTVRANGRLDFSSTTEVTLEEVDFGEPIERVRTRTKSDLVITGGSQEPLDEDTSLSKAELDVALAERKERLENQKSRDMSRTAHKQTPAPSTGGSGFDDLGF